MSERVDLDTLLQQALDQMPSKSTKRAKDIESIEERREDLKNLTNKILKEKDTTELNIIIIQEIHCKYCCNTYNHIDSVAKVAINNRNKTDISITYSYIIDNIKPYLKHMIYVETNVCNHCLNIKKDLTEELPRKAVDILNTNFYRIRYGKT